MIMKIKYIVLCLLLALVGCQRDEEMEIGQVSIGNERLEASYSSVEISCSFQTNVTIKNVQAYLSTEADFSSAKSYSLSEKEKNTFGATIEGLKDASTYYVRYEVSNRWSSKMIDKVSEFKTIPYTIPTVQTSEVSDVTHSTAIVGGVIAENGGQEITERGVVYSKSPNPSIENGTKVESLEKAESYACTLMDLEYVTTYYVRAYAINEKGVAYGEEVSFMTKAKTIATVATTPATNVSYTSATVGGNVTDDGGAGVTERGICYSTSANPTTANTKITSDSGLGEFMCNLTDLQDGTIYYVRAYAINEKGTAYGEEVSFTTIAKTVATVTTSHATNVSYTSATVGGNVTKDGGAEVIERGIVYSTNQNPTAADSKVTNGSGLGEFTCNLIDLQDATTYYARAYAINEKGTAYGEEVSFTTKALSGIENGYTWVDLGLSVKWATMNVGATKPEEYGDYFAWGETEPKEVYDWSTYKHCRGSYTTLTKYNTDSNWGTVDNKTKLDAIDDAAVVNWGGTWRMPTDAELTELREQCTWSWTTQNGVNGYKVTSKSNGNSIFLPAAGWRLDSLLDRAGNYGYYWSSSLYTDSPFAWLVDIDSRGVSRCIVERYPGLSVRPVCP